MKQDSERYAVGIDLGTTYSAIAEVDEFGKAAIIPNAESERITPSIILFDGNNVIVGTIAKHSALSEPENVVQYVKREMGKPKESYSSTFNETTYSAEELSALILKKLKLDAERYIDHPITDAVITVPAYFNDAQRGATLRAGQIAGFNVLSVINEPTAAALAYGLDKSAGDETVFVFDLGGGTFDVTIMRVESGGIKMIATDGDGFLGGKDWDNLLADMVAESFIEKYGEDPREDLDSHQDLMNRALGAKIQLSSRPRTTLVLNHHGRSQKLQITREEFEEVAKPLVERLRRISEAVVHQAKLDFSAIDRILLVGGMTRMPMIRRMLEDLSGLELTDTVNPDEAVAIGAAIQSVLCLLDEEKESGEKLVKSAVRDMFRTKTGDFIQVTNIASHSLGVVLWDSAKKQEFVYRMIDRGSELPSEVTNRFGTSKPEMETVTIRVVEGESLDPDMCSSIGTVEVALPNKVPQGSEVSVTYRYDSNQILQVIAKVAGKEAEVTIDRKAGMTEEELAAAKDQFGQIKVS